MQDRADRVVQWLDEISEIAGVLRTVPGREDLAHQLEAAGTSLLEALIEMRADMDRKLQDLTRANQSQDTY